MKMISKLVAITLLLPTVCFSQDRNITGYPELPKDAREVAERSVACEHFAGEINGTGDERDQQVSVRIKKLRCDVLPRDVERVRKKYRNQPETLRLINQATEWLNEQPVTQQPPSSPPPEPAPVPYDGCTRYRVEVVSKPDTAALFEQVHDSVERLKVRAPNLNISYENQIVKLGIDADGAVNSVGILKSSGNRDIDRAVFVWAKKLVFSKDECAQKRIRYANLPINISQAVEL